MLVEVPLVVKLPAGFQRKLAMPASHVANVRVAPTLIEAAGGKLEPGVAPSLFQPFDKGALSELYLGDGVNRFSLVDGDLQLLWESRFAPPEPDYYRARYAGIGGTPEPPLTEPVQAIFGRLEKAFGSVLPLSGRRGDPPRLTLVRWSAGSVQPVNDPREVNRMARRLKNAWLAANGSEVPPGRSTGHQPRAHAEGRGRSEGAGVRGGGFES